MTASRSKEDASLWDLSGFFVETLEPPATNFRGEPTYLEPALPADLFLTGAASSSGTQPARAARLNTSSNPSLGSLGSLGSVGSLSPQTAPGIGPGRHVRSPDPDLPEIGAVIDKYRIEELVGVGGFAAVYRATHLLLHVPVALKLLRPRVLKKKPELAPLLCEEARFAARINHPNVVRVNDVTHTPLITYVVIEYIEGGSLADAIAAAGQIPIPTALRIGIDVAEGLQAGLLAGLIHRDIKPANILLTKSGQAKVADLGLARVQGGEASVLDNKGLIGTPGYMAPEQSVDAQSVDFRADIYSLGVTLYHAMVGSPPFQIKDRQRSLEQHRTMAPPKPSARMPGFPSSVEGLLMRMLAKLPSDRPSSYPSLVAELRSILETLPGIN